MTRTSRRAVLAPLVAALLLLTSGCAGSASPGRASATARACDLVASAPFDCHVYLSVAAGDPAGDAGWLVKEPVRMWFEHLDGALTLVVDGPVNAIDVPVRSVPGRISSDGKHAASTLVGCVRSDRCSHDGWLLRFFTHPVTYRFDGRRVVMSSSVGTITVAPSTATPPR